ncbi:hypothetical protein [Fibrella arboris]|uniref:hypothetical protein n=1 Tax=Fibrella arboris TaxID=3242486 RepID=UPI003522BBBF
MDNQQVIDDLAKRAEAILEEGINKADSLLVKNASIRTQLEQFKRDVSERLAQQDKSEPLHP